MPRTSPAIYLASVVALLLSNAASAAAPGLVGKWQGTITAGDDTSTQNLVLEVSGTRVRGTAGDKESQLQIQNGTLSGNKVTFRVTVPGGTGVAFDYDLTLDGDALRGTVTMKLGDTQKEAKAEFHREK